MISQGEGCREDVGGDGSTHVKCSKNHQLQSFKPLGYISWVTVMYLHPEGRGKTAGSNELGTFLVTPLSGRGIVIPIFFRGFFVLVVTCPRPPLFARPKKYPSCLSLHSQGVLSWVTVTYFTPPGGGRITAGSNALGAFLVFISFLGGHLPQTFARPKQYSPATFVRLEFIRQNFHESWCRKLLAI